MDLWADSNRRPLFVNAGGFAGAFCETFNAGSARSDSLFTLARAASAFCGSGRQIVVRFTIPLYSDGPAVGAKTCQDVFLLAARPAGRQHRGAKEEVL